MDFDPRNCMRVWEHDGLRIELFETARQRPMTGQTLVAYRFFAKVQIEAPGDPRYRLLAEGGDYGVAMGDTIDGDSAVAGLLHFMALRRGDTDAEFFDDHTASHLAWLDTDQPDDVSLYLEGMEDTGHLPDDMVRDGIEAITSLKAEEYSRD